MMNNFIPILARKLPMQQKRSTVDGDATADTTDSSSKRSKLTHHANSSTPTDFGSFAATLDIDDTNASVVVDTNDSNTNNNTTTAAAKMYSQEQLSYMAAVADLTNTVMGDPAKLYTPEQIKYIDEIEAEMKTNFPITKIGTNERLWTNFPSFRDELRAFCAKKGFSVRTQGTQLVCTRASYPNSVVKKLEARKAATDESKRRNRISNCVGCCFVINYRIVGTVGRKPKDAPDGSVFITSANYRHTNGCAPSAPTAAVASKKKPPKKPTLNQIQKLTNQVAEAISASDNWHVLCGRVVEVLSMARGDVVVKKEEEEEQEDNKKEEEDNNNNNKDEHYEDMYTNYAAMIAAQTPKIPRVPPIDRLGKRKKKPEL